MNAQSHKSHYAVYLVSPASQLFGKASALAKGLCESELNFQISLSERPIYSVTLFWTVLVIVRVGAFRLPVSWHLLCYSAAQ